MQRYLRTLATAAPLFLAMFAGGTADAQQQGGVVQMSHFDSPASMSVHEEATLASLRPMMGVFNNLVMYKQDVAQNSMQSVVPDLATGWNWNEEGTELTFPLRHGVKWHDGKPFTANDVKCTWDMLQGKASEKLRLNPRKSWYRNLEEVTLNGDFEITFRLKRPQPSLLAMLASGWSAVYPCHVPPRDMRLHPIGTARSNSSNSSRTSRSGRRKIRITGSPIGRISTVSSTRSYQAFRQGSLASSPASSTRSLASRSLC